MIPFWEGLPRSQFGIDFDGAMGCTEKYVDKRLWYHIKYRIFCMSGMVFYEILSKEIAEEDTRLA